MAVLKMQKISICALKKDRKAILEQLQHLGVLEVDRDKEEDAFFQKMDTSGQRMKFEKAATAADQALGILDAYAPEKKSLLSSLEGKELIDRELEEKVQTSGPDLIKTARRIYDAVDGIRCSASGREDKKDSFDSRNNAGRSYS